jgi:hypothetical protein
MDATKRTLARDELNDGMAEFLSKGGTITKCPPGPSEAAITRGSEWRRGRPPPAANKAAKEPAAPPAGETETAQTSYP